jgi:hypothetical protein
MIFIFIFSILTDALSNLISSEPAHKVTHNFSSFFQPARTQSTGYQTIETDNDIKQRPSCTIV